MFFSAISSQRKVSRASLALSLGAGAALVFSTVKNARAAGADAISIAGLQKEVAGGRIISSFRLEGVVCASERNLLALQDDSATALLELPSLDAGIRPGDRVEITCQNCAATRNRFGIQLGTAPVVNDDGHHGPFTKSGEVYLRSGMEPFRLTWFNGVDPSVLKAECEGPNIPRQVIPPELLFCNDGNSNFAPGLAYYVYVGSNWQDVLPDFNRVQPVAHGVATNGIGLSYRTRPENVGLIFDGFIKIPVSGIYTFYVTSDDGSFIYAGNPAADCHVAVISHKDPPAPRSFQDTLLSGIINQWTRLEGRITFVGADPELGQLKLDVAGQGAPVQVEILGGANMYSPAWLGAHAEFCGVVADLPDLEAGQKVRMVVPSANQLKILPANKAGATKVLTTAREVRDLTPEKARQHLSAELKGVVTWCSPRALVLQDASGGVYVWYWADDWTKQPRVGEFWEITGPTDAGDFSPVIAPATGKFLGNAALPDPIHPTWEQVLNGSLDAEYVELRGALTEVKANSLTLLTSEGKILIERSDDRPLPCLPELPKGESYLDSIVRIRGCFTAHWDDNTRLVHPGYAFLSPGTVEVEEFAPKNPFAIPAKKAADLLRFDPNLNVLRRTKVRGQVVLAKCEQYFLQDETTGLRVRSKAPMALSPGDMVEAVGFAQIGGPSPVLQEAQIQVLGRAPLPSAVSLAGAELRNPRRDSTLIQTVATLLDVRPEREGKMLELQSAQNHFVAHLPRVNGAESPQTGSLVRLTGVYVSQADQKFTGNPDAFELWLNSEADIEVLQRPPWWNLNRALAIVAVLSSILGVAAIWIALLRRKVEQRTAELEKQIEERQAVEQRRVMELERARVAQDLHDELGAGLTEVGLLGDLVRNPVLPGAEKQAYLGQLTEIARSLVTSLDAIVWAINPRYDSVASLASYYTLFAQRFLNLAGIACRPNIPADFDECPLNTKGRHGLFLAFKEALNNVVRHAGATEVRLTIQMQDGDLVILIADNGCGIVFTDAPCSEGLQGMRQRLEQLGGHCEIRTRPGEGTEVEMRLPVGKLVP